VGDSGGGAAGGSRWEPLLIEATSNQVNQQGGTRECVLRLSPAVLEIASVKSAGSPDYLLAATIWGRIRAEAHEEEAMALAEAMVAEYAQAGFTKLHLDASMACAGEASPLADEVVAERAARLCAAAEKAARTASWSM